MSCLKSTTWVSFGSSKLLVTFPPFSVISCSIVAILSERQSNINVSKLNCPTLSRISPEPKPTPSLPSHLTSHLWGNRDKTSWARNKCQPGETVKFLQVLEYELRVILVCMEIISHLNFLLVRCEGRSNHEFFFAYHLHVGRTLWSLELDLNGDSYGGRAIRLTGS
jgi:hypothetical protein